jgi:hypothetical protein
MLTNFSSYLSNFPLIVFGVASAGVAYTIYSSYIEYYNLNRLIEVENLRTQQNLPNEVTITPEEFTQNPELIEMFGVTDVNNALNIPLEQNEHLAFLAAQNNMDNIETALDIVSQILF